MAQKAEADEVGSMFSHNNGTSSILETLSFEDLFRVIVSHRMHNEDNNGDQELKEDTYGNLQLVGTYDNPVFDQSDTEIEDTGDKGSSTLFYLRTKNNDNDNDNPHPARNECKEYEDGFPRYNICADEGLLKSLHTKKESSLATGNDAVMCVEEVPKKIEKQPSNNSNPLAIDAPISLLFL